MLNFKMTNFFTSLSVFKNITTINFIWSIIWNKEFTTVSTFFYFFLSFTLFLPLYQRFFHWSFFMFFLCIFHNLFPVKHLLALVMPANCSAAKQFPQFHKIRATRLSRHPVALSMNNLKLHCITSCSFCLLQSIYLPIGLSSCFFSLLFCCLYCNWYSLFCQVFSFYFFI